MAVILITVPAQNNMSSQCFITFLNTIAQTERSGSNPRLLPRCLHSSHPSLLRWKVASAAATGGGTSGNAVEWAWAMNAASSVLGSVLAIVIAIHWGLIITLACGAGAYLAAVTLSPVLKPTGVQRQKNLGGEDLKPEFVAWQP
jgi:hypothetical protein